VNSHHTPAGRRPPNPRPFSRSARPLPPLLNLLGLALPLLVSLLATSINLSILFLPWLTFLLGVVSAALLRSWSALVSVPVTLTIGTLPSIIFIAHGLPDVTGPGFIAGVILYLLSALIPAVIGTVLGVPLGHELERLDAASTA
jgi:hypothetical protein